MTPSFDLLTGRDESQLAPLGNDADPRLHREVKTAFETLAREAKRAGLDPAVASGFRGYERQLLIWNGKATGQRPIQNEDGTPFDRAGKSDEDVVYAILRFSALPGASRHHWGTDFDIYDRAAVPADYKVELTADESDTTFSALHRWLDQHAARFGFYRPYDRDRGGVAPERWHFSYAPLAGAWEDAYSAEVFAKVAAEPRLALGAVVQANAEELYERFVRKVAACP